MHWLFMGLLGMGCAVILNYRDQQRKVHAGLCFSCRYHYGSSIGGARRRRGRCPEGRCRGIAGMTGVSGGTGSAGGGSGCVENGVGGSGTRAVYMQNGPFGGLYVSKTKQADQGSKHTVVRDNSFGIRHNVLAAVQDGRYEGISGKTIVGSKESPVAYEEDDSEGNGTQISKSINNCTDEHQNAEGNSEEVKENSERFAELITEFDPLVVAETTNVAEEAKTSGVDPEVGNQVYVRWIMTHNRLISATCSCGAWDPASLVDRKKELLRLQASYASDSSATSSPLPKRPQVEGETAEDSSGSIKRASSKQRGDHDDDDDDDESGDSDVASGGSFESKRDSVGRSEGSHSSDERHGKRARTAGCGECSGCNESRGAGSGNGPGGGSKERYMKVVGRYNKRILMRCSLSPHCEVPIHLFRALGTDGEGGVKPGERKNGSEKTLEPGCEKVGPKGKGAEEGEEEGKGEERKGDDKIVFKRPIIKTKTKSLKKLRGVQAKRFCHKGKLKLGDAASGVSGLEASNKSGNSAEASSQGTGYSVSNTSKKKSRGSSMATVHKMSKRKGNYIAVGDDDDDEEEEEEQEEEEEGGEDHKKEEDLKKNDGEEEEEEEEEEGEWEEDDEEGKEGDNGYDDTRSVSSATALIPEEEDPGRRETETRNRRKKASNSIRAKLSKAMKKAEGSARPKRAVLKPAEVFAHDKEDSSLEDLILPASQAVASTFSPASPTSSIASSSTASLSMLIPHSREDHFADEADDGEKASSWMQERQQPPIPVNRRTVAVFGRAPAQMSDNFRTLRVSQSTHRWHLRRPQYRLSSPFH
ncbi:uncharacterized protein LOC143024418 isoform X2 [Oratosquilla oratoria]|uniref:uncharacterized protein LOC143024418 isoform X2 n=1 Tax=Oratosquilla oratoria TaxID=337810 RepID=UPI003F75959E